MLESLTNTLASGSTLSFSQAFMAILLAYLGGILASLTPCIYPMIPITVSVVGGFTQTRRSWHEIWIRCFSYIGGMAVIYAFLGVAAGLTGRVFGSFTNTSGWYLTLSIVLNIGALAMLDVLSFDLSLGWAYFKKALGFKKKHVTHSHSHHPSEMTWVSAFTLGASSGFIAAPCTTPILTSILAYIAKTQSIGLGLVLMLAFASGLGTLLFLVGAFTGALKLLPKSGHWMNRIKTASGLILLAFAEFLIFRAGGIQP